MTGGSRRASSSLIRGEWQGEARWPVLMLLCILASLLVPGIASATTAAGAETRDGVFDLAEQVRVGVEASLTLELRPGCEPTYDQLASDSLLAARGAARAVDPNTLNHIFRPGHNLDGLVRASGGSTEGAFNAAQQAANQALREGLLAPGANGVLPGAGAGAILNVNGVNVQMIGGRVIDGAVHIGSLIGL